MNIGSRDGSQLSTTFDTIALHELLGNRVVSLSDQRKQCHGIPPIMQVADKPAHRTEPLP